MITDVKVYIKSSLVAGRLGFGFPLILSSLAGTTAPADVSNYKEYNSLLALTEDYDIETDIYKTAELMYYQDDGPRTIAVCQTQLNAVAAITALAEKGWRQLVVLPGEPEDPENDPADSTHAQIATTIELYDDKLYFMHATTTTEIAEVANKERTIAMFYDATTTWPAVEAAIVGASAGREPGSFTYKNLIIRQVDPIETLTEAGVDDLHDAGGITLLRKAGDVVTSEGINTNKEFIDIVDSKDFIISNIEYDTQKLLNNSAKVPYTDSGIAQLENCTINVLKTAYNMGIIADDDNGIPMFATNFLPRADMSEADRASRIYTGGIFSFSLAGAIHKVEINGELII